MLLLMLQRLLHISLPVFHTRMNQQVFLGCSQSATPPLRYAVFGVAHLTPVSRIIEDEDDSLIDDLHHFFSPFLDKILERVLRYSQSQTAHRDHRSIFLGRQEPSYIVGGQRGGLPTYLFQDFYQKRQGVPPYNFRKKIGFEFSRNFYQKGRVGIPTIFPRTLLEKEVSPIFLIPIYLPFKKIESRNYDFRTLCRDLEISRISEQSPAQGEK